MHKHLAFHKIIFKKSFKVASNSKGLATYKLTNRPTDKVNDINSFIVKNEPKK